MLEILAPAGDFPSLKAAVCCGATSVYIGFSRFSARANAENFDNDAIIQAIDYCHLRGVKLYCVINTLIKDSELDTLYNDINFLYCAGIDAIILQDLAVAQYIKDNFPALPIFASTQMTAYNLDSAKFLENFGFKRVILSRELSGKNIEYIVKNTNLDVEIFGHGAICMCYSGQCHMSSVIAERSGNRGRCAQPCRLSYSVINKNGTTLLKDKTVLSPKDMSLIDHLDEIKRIGVHSLKIEGRMKAPTYVGAVTSVYSKYANSDLKVSDSDKKLLTDVFSRGGFTDGYFTSKKGKAMIDTESLESNKVSLTKDQEKLIAATINSDPRKLDISISVSFTSKDGLVVTASYKDFSVTEKSLNVEIATNKPITQDRLKEQLLKLGQTTFECTSYETNEFEDNLIIPISEINNTRRKVCDTLAKDICDSYKRDLPHHIKTNKYEKTQHDLTSFSAMVMTLSQAKEVLKHNFKRLYVPLSIYNDVVNINNTNTLICAIVPEIVHDDRASVYDKITPDMPLYVSNIGHLHRFRDNMMFGDFRLNVFNSQSAYELAGYGLKSVCVSPELTLKEASAIKTQAEKEMIIYGRIPAMITENCALASSCQKGNGMSYLKDRKGYMFPVIADCSNCTNIILNSAPIYMADKYTDLNNADIDTGLFLFTIETANECAEIISNYKNKSQITPKEFTRGHLYKKVL